MLRRTLAVVALIAAACGPAVIDEGPHDDADASFGDGKADNAIFVAEGSSDALGILALVNTADEARLDGPAGLYATAARNIFAHRVGQDGLEGTRDDDPFDTLAELDAVSYVGPVALEHLLAFARAEGYVPPAAEAPTDDLGSALGDRVVAATTAGAANTRGSACGGGAAPDRAFRWTAPITAEYRFDTLGSALSTVLYVIDADGAGHLACNDEAGPETHQSELTVHLAAGQAVYVVVDGYAYRAGDFIVAIHFAEPALACAARHLGGAVGPDAAVGGAMSQKSESAGSCAGDLDPEVAYAWVAPADGHYVFDARGSAPGAALYVRTACDGAELACDPGVGRSALVELNLLEGEQVVLFLDGPGAADHRLAIYEGAAPDLCDAQPLGSVVGPEIVAGDTTLAQSRLAGSCGGADTPEQVFTWTAPRAATYRFDTFGSSLSTVLYVLDGDCRGVELACNDDADGTHQSAVTVQLAAGQEVVLVVDGYGGRTGTFVLGAAQIDVTGLRDLLQAETTVTHTPVGYDAARRAMFSTIDNHGGAVECVYTGRRTFTKSIPVATDMNTEHTWAQSWGIASAWPARADLHHLFPTDSSANSIRGNKPFGEVEAPYWTVGGSASGRDAAGAYVFEPRDVHKGDVARALFYFSVRYGSDLETAQEKTLRRWHREDPVDDAERARNDAVAAQQGNRNPFVDHPEFVGQISDL